MNDMFFWVLLICFYPILWMVLGGFAFAAKYRKGMIFGLSLPPEGKEDPAVEVISRRCRHGLWLLAIPFTVAPIAFFFVTYISVALTLWFCWVLLAIFIPPLVFHYYYRCMKKLKQVRGWSIDREEEAFWLWGMFYCNPKNPRSMVKKRVGAGTTLNMARFGGKFLVIFTIVCLFSMPGLGVWLMVEDFTPVKVFLSSAAIEVSHWDSEIQVNYDDVIAAALFDEMPSCSRTAGTSLTYLEKGRYRVRDYGSARICIDRRVPVVMMLETENDIYFISLKNRAAAESLIEKINFK